MVLRTGGNGMATSAASCIRPVLSVPCCLNMCGLELTPWILMRHFTRLIWNVWHRATRDELDEATKDELGKAAREELGGSTWGLSSGCATDEVRSLRHVDLDRSFTDEALRRHADLERKRNIAR